MVTLWMTVIGDSYPDTFETEMIHFWLMKFQLGGFNHPVVHDQPGFIDFGDTNPQN